MSCDAEMINTRTLSQSMWLAVAMSNKIGIFI